MVRALLQLHHDVNKGSVAVTLSTQGLVVTG